MPEGTDVFEIMHTMRAMRRLKPDPVPDELIRRYWRPVKPRRAAAIHNAGAFWC